MSTSDWGFLTGIGPAAIAIIRLRGPAVADFLTRHVVFHTPVTLDELRPNLLRRANLVERSGDTVDDCLILIESITPGWTAQIHLHGSLGIAERMRELLTDAGFQTVEVDSADTHDLAIWSTNAMDSEVLATLPRYTTIAGARWLLRTRSALPRIFAAAAAADSLEEANLTIAPLLENARLPDKLTTPTRVAIVGPPNAGKSTLINALTDRVVSLVADRPGTTRDWIEAPGEADGFPVVWIDTAGMRNADQTLEAQSIERAIRIAASADVLVVVLDGSSAGRESSEQFVADYAHLSPAILVYNKSDLEPYEPASAAAGAIPFSGVVILVSAKVGTGVDAFQSAVANCIWRSPLRAAGPAPASLRQRRALEKAAAARSLAEFHTAITACLEPVS